MSDPNTLGGIVRRRRLESGYSLGQLASKVGKTAAEVRSWERDAELPEHGIIERLVETLELDLDDINQRLDEGKKAFEAEKKAAAAAENLVTEPDVPIDVPEEDAVEVAADEEELPGFAVDDPFTPPAADDTDEFEPVAVEEEPEFDLLDAPTEAVPVPIITETAAAARASRAAALLEEPAPLPMVESAPDADPGLLRYLEPLRLLFDPSSRYLYWIRAALTVVVMLIFAVVLLDQLGKLLDAVGELLDTIEPTAKDPDDLNALGFFLG
jgi:transcriptional regulator with XRE-family HTH domain